MARGQFSRKTDIRFIGKKIIIICEGDTEELYFEAIRKNKRLPTVKIQVINPSCSDPLSIVNRAIEVRLSLIKDKVWLEKDQVWACFDGDEHRFNDERNWKKAISLANSKDVNLAISNPSFELWYLLHYQEQNANLRRDQALTLLKGYLPNYTKTLVLYPTPLEVLTDIASKRAEILTNRTESNSEKFGNPSTCIYKLIAELNKLKIKR